MQRFIMVVDGPSMKTTRRDWISALALAGLAPAAADANQPAPDYLDKVVKRHDEAVDRFLKGQITDPTHPHCGGFPDSSELFYPGTAAGLVNAFYAAWLHPLSRHHRQPLMIDRLRLAARYLKRVQTPDGNIDLPITNFNSPPDTAFAIQSLGPTANLARRNGPREVVEALDPFLRQAAQGLLRGGVHTPNHRWVVCSALAYLYEHLQDPALVRRAEAWLAEGVDIDEDGQYDERSIIGYNVITDRALILTAHKLKRPELFEPVRKNLDAAFWLMHPDGEMVTEISRRQDRNQRGEIGVYWFPMHYMAIKDANPHYAWVARKYAAERASLSDLLEFPELLGRLPEPALPPDNYEKVFPALEMARIRRGDLSATLLLRGDSRFFLLRYGEVVISAVRFASAFFGKGQFIPVQWTKQEGGYVLRQLLYGPYFQPLDPPHRVKALEWDETRPERARSQVAILHQIASLQEMDRGFRLRIQAYGTDQVPLAVEVGIRQREGLRIDGVLRAPGVVDGYILAGGYATASFGKHAIRFGPGQKRHAYTQVRGAEPKLADGASIYITGYTPFDHTLEFQCL